MGWFSKAPKDVGPVTDDQWLSAGSSRYEKQKGSYFGSPETMRAGGEEFLGQGDAAAALFFFAKAIDIAQTWSFARAGERDPRLDQELFGLYLETVKRAMAERPGMDLTRGPHSDELSTSGNYMVQLAGIARSQGFPTGQTDDVIRELYAVTGMSG